MRMIQGNCNLTREETRRKQQPPISNRGFAKLFNGIFLSMATIFVCLELCDILILPTTLFYQKSYFSCLVAATSINYGISQQPITGLSQLMPKLCQNQTVICEGSFCIPGVRKCVCDLRMPVQFGRFCLRQLDIEMKCFVTSQCNHTIKDAVCIDLNSNAILDPESSKFKLDQWQQLNELRQLNAVTKDVPNKQTNQIITTVADSNQDRKWSSIESPFESGSGGGARFRFIELHESNHDVNNVLYSDARNSPYEINYDTNELLSQNHTRRRTNQSDRSTNNLNQNMKQDTQATSLSTTTNIITDPNYISLTSTSPSTIITTNTAPITTIKAISNPTTGAASTVFTTNSQTTPRYSSLDTTTYPSNSDTTGNERSTLTSDSNSLVTTTTLAYNSNNNDDMNNNNNIKKKMIVKTPNWPPGVCLCPFGYMFDAMLRKCLALSLSDSRCQVDTDCRQIVMTHCSIDTKKCECDEPLVWNQTELACLRPKPPEFIENPQTKKENGTSFLENLLPPLILAKLLPDYTMMLLIFVIIVIIGTLIILKLTVKCFSSSSSSALISPKSKKAKKSQQQQQSSNSTLPPRSPYATLRRPDHKPSSQLSNFTQATRGRILNYDFEQEGPLDESDHPAGGVPLAGSSCNTAPRMQSASKNNNSRSTNDGRGSSATLKVGNKGHQHQHNISNNQKYHSNNDHRPSRDSQQQRGPRAMNNESIDEPTIELNDNISVGQMESESKASENSVLTIPAPPPTQQPPYMLASAMKGQGSAIAAAAAAVANKRIQMAQKKNLEQQSSGNMGNGSPVFL